MLNYQPLYTTLFNAITDALRLLDTDEVAEAKMLLIRAQQKTEELYMEEEP